jgi:hypothetical protein
VLPNLIDRALDSGAAGQDPCLLACAGVLYRKGQRVVDVEARTLYRPKGSDAA